MLDSKVKVFHEQYFMFHEMTLKLYFVKCFERKISQCILPFSSIKERNCLVSTGMCVLLFGVL